MPIVVGCASNIIAPPYPPASGDIQNASDDLTTVKPLDIIKIIYQQMLYQSQGWTYEIFGIGGGKGVIEGVMNYIKQGPPLFKLEIWAGETSTQVVLHVEINAFVKPYHFQHIIPTRPNRDHESLIDRMFAEAQHVLKRTFPDILEANQEIVKAMEAKDEQR